MAKRKAKSLTLELSWVRQPEGSSLLLSSSFSCSAVAVVAEGSKSQQVWGSMGALRAPLLIHHPKGLKLGLNWRDTGASWASPTPAKSCYLPPLPAPCTCMAITKDMPKPLRPHRSLKVQPRNLPGCMAWSLRIIEVKIFRLFLGSLFILCFDA